MLYSNTRTTPRSEHSWLVSAATDVWSTPPPSFRILRPHMSIPVVMTSRIWRWPNGVKRFTPAVRHINVNNKHGDIHTWSSHKLYYRAAPRNCHMTINATNMKTGSSPPISRTSWWWPNDRTFPRFLISSSVSPGTFRGSGLNRLKSPTSISLSFHSR